MCKIFVNNFFVEELEIIFFIFLLIDLRGTYWHTENNTHTNVAQGIYEANKIIGM